MLGHKLLLSRTSSAARGRALVSEKVLVDKLLVSKKMLGGKYLLCSRTYLISKYCVWECPRV